MWFIGLLIGLLLGAMIGHDLWFVGALVGALAGWAIGSRRTPDGRFAEELAALSSEVKNLGGRLAVLENEALRVDSATDRTQHTGFFQAGPGNRARGPDSFSRTDSGSTDHGICPAKDGGASQHAAPDP